MPSVVSSSVQPTRHVAFPSRPASDEKNLKAPSIASPAPFTKHDVLSGRGGLANVHPGNRVYRRLVNLNRARYQQLDDKRDRARLVESIILAVQQVGGRFFRQEEGTGNWIEIGFERAFVKTSQALREIPRDGTPARRVATAEDAPLQSHHPDKNLSSRSSKTSEMTPWCPEHLQSPNCDIFEENSSGDILHSDLQDSSNADGIVTLVPPPMLRIWSSALHPSTSKIAGSVEDQRPFQDEPQEEESFPQGSSNECFPSPPISFDDIMARHDSMELTGGLTSYFQGTSGDLSHFTFAGAY